MESSHSSLNNLSDIVLPDPVPLWPLGQGAYLLLIAVVIVVGLFTYLYSERYRANQYRRAGLSLLGNAVTVYDVSVVVKRVALAVFPREEVASLYGHLWTDFLKETCPGSNLEGLQSHPEKMADQELLDAARFWIRNHKMKSKR